MSLIPPYTCHSIILSSHTQYSCSYYIPSTHYAIHIYTKPYIYSSLCQAHSIHTCHTIPHTPSHTYIYCYVKCIYVTNYSISHIYTNYLCTHVKEIQDLTMYVIYIPYHTPILSLIPSTHKHNRATCYIPDLDSNRLSLSHCIFLNLVVSFSLSDLEHIKHTPP